MFSRREFSIILLFASVVLARPGDDSDVGPDFTLDGEVVSSVESRFSFPDDDEAPQVVDVALEHGDFYQGDIKLLAEQREILDRLAVDKTSLSSRTGILNEDYRWPKDSSGNVKVPYEFAKSSKYCEPLRMILFSAFNQFLTQP